MSRWLVLATLCVLGFWSGASGDQRKMVRMSLGRATAVQGGDLGQPLTSYYTNVNIGTPAKSFKLLVDINAREVWVPHYLKLGIIYQRLNYKDGYAKKDSSTSKKEDQEYTISYDGTELTGKAYKDLFEFKNITESLMPVKYTQRFLAISSASNDKFARRQQVDGVMALNPFPISETGSDLITVGFNRANLTSELKFSLLLHDDSKSPYGGELVFGPEDRTKYLGSLRYHQAIGQHKWELNLQSVMFGSSVVSCADGPCTATISTNRNDIYGPLKDVQHILISLGVIRNTSEYKDNQLHEIDCLKVANSPSLTFVIDGAYYTLHPLSYIKKKVDGIVFKSSTCYVSIISNGSQKQWELGTNFLFNHYTVFDISKRQVAFGLKH